MPRRILPEQSVELMPPGGLTWVSGCSADSALLADGIAAAGDRLGDASYTGIVVAGLNRTPWAARADTLTFFMTPELAAAGARADFRPLCYADIAALLARRPPDAALFMCSPPDAAGRCSFGTTVDFLADRWSDVPVRIAHINPAMPRTPGDPGIPFDALTGYLEGEQALPTLAEGARDGVAERIGALVAAFVPDGAVVQTGLGKLPGAVLRALTGHRGLRLHTGLIGDAVLDLLAAGALAPGPAVLAGVAIGSQRLYDAVSGPEFEFRPPSVTHDAAAIAARGRLVAINSALEVDLYGQVHAELGPRGWASGPGGASDFARAARESGGLRIVVLPAAAAGGTLSRIVPAGAGAGPVSLGRFDTDVVVTEHGAADLRGLGHEARAAALVAIAAPAHQDALARGWRDAHPLPGASPCPR